ncbi:MAG TPA: pyruvate carboxylase [Thermomicrobiales bacterium]|nr:pyruvate carboxylase [Thermomicrobiales bacterium]
MGEAFGRILVANRGEIAVRVFQACTELGKQTIAIYSEADAFAPHRYKADEAYLVGAGQTPVGAYLDAAGIVALAAEQDVDAIHPGYGFLAENADFARRCRDAGIAFIGPDPEHLDLFGDKTRARALAQEVGIPILPGTPEPVHDDAAALAFAREHGYPLMVKAVGGGGGRGMRAVRDEAGLRDALAAARREAAAAFGTGAVYLERLIEDPRHVEVQILGDRAGRVVHLHERDCSIQRRHQKLVEIAPATALPPELRRAICHAAVRLLAHVGYVNAATVEFLVGADGRFSFIEVNPRIQVEHTVTELITGVDIVQAQIRLAEGTTLADLGLWQNLSRGLATIPPPRGVAIQCRVTTEDPERDFLPDTGRITTFRTAGGFGVRLDVGNGFDGAEVTPHYDSLLVKICTWGRDLPDAARKMSRTLQEFRVRGVQTNIPFLDNVVRHPDFLAGRIATTFIDTHPELLRFPPSRDRGTKLLRYLAHTAVNGAYGPRPAAARPAAPPPAARAWRGETAKAVLDRAGPEGLARWVAAEERLLLTDTTMRDAHQSLLATRMRTHDLLRAAPATAAALAGLFSLECWGGATFDAAYRFLREDPWERLAALRAALPDALLQMLLRGQSLVGYGAYPDNVVAAFVREAARAGIDVFRVFDSLNYLPNMTAAIAAVRDAGKVAEVAMCYTGDILDPRREKYTLRYYLDLAREIERAGAHILAIKDMAGLLKPQAAYELVRALKAEVGLPLHLHTHDAAGNGVALVLKAAEAGVDIADGALGSMAGGTAQPSLNAIIAAAEGTPRATGLDADALLPLVDYWAAVRRCYAPFEGGPIAPDAGAYRHQMPGGQYTNLQQQAAAVGLGDRWPAVVEAYHQVDRLLGEPIKVTPSSKAVGDFALWVVQNGLAADEIVPRAAELDLPQSVVELLSGRLGQPPYGFPEALQRVALKGRAPITDRPGALLPPADLDARAAELAATLDAPPTPRDTLSSLLYPEVYREYAAFREEYGDVAALDTPTFLHGLRAGETATVAIEPGKTLIVGLTAIGEPLADGTRTIHCELNGRPREVRVRDLARAPARAARPKAARGDWREVGAAMPGKVLQLAAAPGQRVARGDRLLILEAMKMETVVTAPRDATVSAVLVGVGDTVAAGDLLATLAD